MDNCCYNAFTKNTDGLNLEVDNLNVSCITSKNDKFSVDSLGNITANSISLVNGGSLNDNDIYDKIYPVGSIYLSVNNTNPGNLFSGTWVPFGVGRTLVGVDTSQTEFNSVEKVGGEKSHALSIPELPSHNHKFPAKYGANTQGISALNWELNCSNWQYYPTENVGENKAHNNLQPYITCYMWKRTA